MIILLKLTTMYHFEEKVGDDMTRIRGKKGEIRQCRYKYCLHDTRIIDRGKDEFIKNKSAYYHKDCYEHKLRNGYKETTTDTYKIDHNSATEQDVLTSLFNEGYSKEYILFTLKNLMNNPKIKEEYKNYKESNNVSDDKKADLPFLNDNSPAFKVEPEEKWNEKILN